MQTVSYKQRIFLTICAYFAPIETLVPLDKSQSALDRSYRRCNSSASKRKRTVSR